MKVEYSMPSECGNRISRRSVISVRSFARRSPCPTVSVAHSPTPSAVKIAARRVGAVRKAAAACDAWCPVNKTFRRGTPRSEEMMPRTQTFSPSEFLMAWGNDRHECGNVLSALVRIRSNFRMLRS